MELEESTCLTSGSTTKPQSSRQYGTGIDRNIDQWNRIESPEVNPHTYGHLIFDKEGKNIQQRNNNLFTSDAGKTGQPPVKEPYTKINSKCIKDLNVRPDTIKLLEENRQNTL